MRKAQIPIDDFEDLAGEEQLPGDTLSDDDLLDNDLLGKDYFDDYGYGMGDGGISPMQKHSDLLKTLTNFDIYLKQTVNGWLGVSWNEETSKYVKNPNVKPILNERGAVWCVTLIQNYCRPNNIITNISEKDYRNMIMDIVNTVWLNLTDRATQFGITNNGDILRVCNDVIHASQLVLMGAGDGKYNALLQQSISRQETINLSDRPQYQPQQAMLNQPKKGFFGKLLNKLK